MLPRFGMYRLGHVPADEIENWLNDEIDAGIAPSSVHRQYRTLRRLLQVAVEKQRIATNPCDRVDPPRVPCRVTRRGRQVGGQGIGPVFVDRELIAMCRRVDYAFVPTAVRLVRLSGGGSESRSVAGPGRA